jgi:2Fe-2S ferredoxin
MVKVVFVSHAGLRREVEGPAGLSVMEVATRNGVDGIEAVCGGSQACGTCHCYVNEAWLDRLAPPQALEDELLDGVFERRANSRLSCQIRLRDALDGIEISTPERQL